MKISWRAIGLGAGIAAAMVSAPASAQSLAARAGSGPSLTVAKASNPSPGALGLADRQAVQREIPWYERFTNSAPPSAAFEGTQAVGQGPQLTLPATGRWGLSLDTRQQASSTLRSIRDEAAVSAYFQFTPRLRLGGRLSVTEPARGGATTEAPASSVRIESAFKF